MNRIVVSVDGSPTCTSTARWGARGAAMRKAELVLVNVMHPAMGACLRMGWSAMAVPTEVNYDAAARSEQILSDTVQVLATTAVQHQPPLIATRRRTGAVVPTLSEFTQNADLLVVGRRVRRGIHRTLLGPIGSALMHTSHALSRSFTMGHRSNQAMYRWSSEWTTQRRTPAPARSRRGSQPSGRGCRRGTSRR
jgi:nucleotide-binding universal stress UspA family protein